MTPSLSLAEWLDDNATLTPTELRIVRALGLRLGSWLPTQLLANAVYRDESKGDHVIRADMASLRTHIWRIRRKLASTPWRIENRYQHSTYRLVSRNP